jgi:hypothetical protein
MHKSVALLAGIILLCGGVGTGCERQGPAERAGKDIDRTGEDLKDAAQPPRPAERAGKKVDRAVEDVTRSQPYS